jgi:hypothetical protein
LSDINKRIKNMVDYGAIADAAAAYPDYQTAFNSMSVEMGANTFRDMSPNSLKMWAATFPADYLTLHSGTDAVSLLAMSMISSETTPLYVSDSGIHPFINSLPISQTAIAGLYAMATKTNKAWPNLKAGHVQNAMQKRAEGTV